MVSVENRDLETRENSYSGIVSLTRWTSCWITTSLTETWRVPTFITVLLLVVAAVFTTPLKVLSFSFLLEKIKIPFFFITHWLNEFSLTHLKLINVLWFIYHSYYWQNWSAADQKLMDSLKSEWENASVGSKQGGRWSRLLIVLLFSFFFFFAVQFQCL